MKNSDIVARIRALCPGFATVDHALTSSAEYEYPAAFVAPLKRQPIEQPRLLGQYAQMVRHVVGVYVVLPKRQDAGASSASDDLDTLCAQLRAALVYWTPPGGTDQPISYAGGELTEREGLVCWREDFASDFDLRV